MKRSSLCSLLLISFTSLTLAQTTAENNEDNIILSDDKQTIALNGAYNFTISSTDSKGSKAYDVRLNIPDKANKEYFFPTVSKISTMIAGKEIQIIYDVYSKKDAAKICYIKTMGIDGSGLTASKFLSSTPCKSQFSNSNTNYRVIYSPDRTKFALLLDNFSRGIVIEPIITIYDSRTLTALATKPLSSKYNGEKIQIDPYNGFVMDNQGNISMQFRTHNMETNMVLKSFTAELPFAEKAMINIKEQGEKTTTMVSESGPVDKFENGRCYASWKDVADDKFIPGYKIKNGSYKWATGFGESYDIINADGSIKKMRLKDFPSDLFTYKSSDLDEAFLMKRYEGDTYLVLVAGQFSYYAMKQNQAQIYYSDEGPDGEMKKFKQKILEEYLKKYGLFQSFEKDKPKREFKDSVNDYFNKQIAWHIKYIRLLNEEMKK